MKQPKLFLIAVIALLPLVLVSCIGATQPKGGWSGPTVKDGIIYTGTRDGRVVAINASTQSQQWDHTFASTMIYATPIVDGDLVYVGTYSGKVHALSIADGEDMWDYPRDGYMGAIVGTPVIANETIYVSSSDGRIHALNATGGKRKWESEPLLTGKLWTSPTVIGGTLYVSTYDGHIYGLSAETGKLLDWSFESQAGFTSSPVIDEGTVYVGSFDRYLYAVRIGDSEPLWEFPGSEWFWAAPLISDGVVYAGCLDGKLYAINATTGVEIWSYTTKDQKDKPSPIVSSPVLMDNLLIVVNESGNVYVFDLSVEIEDEAAPLKPISIGASVRSPFCARDGLVYIRGEDNSIYVVDIDKGEVVEGWPVSLTAEE